MFHSVLLKHVTVNATGAQMFQFTIRLVHLLEIHHSFIITNDIDTKKPL